jgi:enamine deaminase RidA (YjgF/YER057c/UK114 family)
MRINHNPESVHHPLAAYTHSIEISGQQRWLVLSGQVGMDSEGRRAEDKEEQFKIALENIRQNLLGVNMDVEDIVKLTFYLVGQMDAENRREVLAGWLRGHQPCMTLVYVQALATSDIQVEIEALACSDEA